MKGGMKHIHVFRRFVQSLYLLFFMYIGIQFFMFCKWATGHHIFVQRPQAVEAFLPLSALVSLKVFTHSGRLDSIHPAGLTILSSVIFASFLFRRGVCAWICPIGLISNLTEIARRYMGTLKKVPQWLDMVLKSIKYAAMSFFVYFIFIKMDLSQAEGFRISPYNIVADARMLKFFTAPSTATVIVILAILVFSLFLKNFWCRYLCPYGALIGLFSALGPIHIKRDEKKCAHCAICEERCPVSIEITEKRLIKTPECIGCLECISSCPKEGCLSITLLPCIKMHPFIVPVGTIAVFLCFYMVARLTGHWVSSVSPQVIKSVLHAINISF